MTLMYLARYTRPDILFATTYLATKCESPTQADMDAALKVVTYLRTTGVLAFVYSGSELSVQVYADASHGVHLDGRGHSCIIITLGSAPIATRSVKQKLVALHSTDAEVIAVTEAATYVLWLRVLLAELQFTLESPIPVHQDNTSAILIYYWILCYYYASCCIMRRVCQMLGIEVSTPNLCLRLKLPRSSR